MKPVVILWGIVYLISFSRTENASDVEVFQGNVLVYEMKFSIPECGTVSEALYKIIQLLDIVPICEVVDQMVSFMDWNRSYTYIGCSEQSQFARSGLIYMHFFVERIDTNVDASCLNSSAKTFNQLIKKRMKIHGTIDSEAFEIKMAVIQRDAIIFRQFFEYSRSEWLESKHLPKESHISRKHQTRLGLEHCLKREQRELMNDSRVYTYWWSGFDGNMICGHLWTHGSAHQTSTQQMRSFFLRCINTTNLTIVQNLEKRETLEIECPSNDSHDNKVQSTNKTLKNSGQEVTIPCRGEYENTTTIPIYSTGVTQPSASISEITTLVSCGTIWIRTFGIIAILPSSSLFINVFFL
ncbi:unnamed protein product [Fasciola hepatica]|uniref:Uncharacterized protein n=1 Tax=Fasciola hepatica TaxID=6192 RepID=A0ABC9HIK1_FASHE